MKVSRLIFVNFGFSAISVFYLVFLCFHKNFRNFVNPYFSAAIQEDVGAVLSLLMLFHKI